ncbi:hypothetical protein V6N13_010760 [Hibiscus sabdariffa]
MLKTKIFGGLHQYLMQFLPVQLSPGLQSHEWRESWSGESETTPFPFTVAVVMKRDKCGNFHDTATCAFKLQSLLLLEQTENGSNIWFLRLINFDPLIFSASRNPSSEDGNFESYLPLHC